MWNGDGRRGSRSEARSAIFPVWFALFDEGEQAFLRVFKAIELVEKDIHGMLQAVAQGHAHTAENGFFCHGEHGTGMRGNTSRNIRDSLFELSLGDEAIDHAEFKSAFGSHWLTGQNQFQGSLGTDEKRENSGRERRKDADGNFRLGETSLGSGDDQIAKCGKLGTTADRGAINDADDGLANIHHPGKSGVEGIEHLKDAL